MQIGTPTEEEAQLRRDERGEHDVEAAEERGDVEATQPWRQEAAGGQFW